MTIAEQLFAEGHAFDFFQAVRILDKLVPNRRPVGRPGPLREEAIRFHAHLSLAFPASSIYEIGRRNGPAGPIADMTVAFMGLTGPSGILPQHYTDLLIRLETDLKGPDRRSFRAWLDHFNHRLISLHYRAWEKYRFYIACERREPNLPDPDAFTRTLLSFIGLGTPGLRHRLRVAARVEIDGVQRPRILDRIYDLSMLYYGAYLANQTRSAVNLEALLRDYFQLAVEVGQFQGQWLYLDPANQTRMVSDGNNQLGINVVAGERVWDVQSKIRVRIGPLSYLQFREFLPSRAPTPARKVFFLLCHLTRLFVGPEIDFDVQLVLRKEDVPGCRMVRGPDGPQLGWNSWIRTREFPHDADDAVFDSQESVWMDPL